MLPNSKYAISLLQKDAYDWWVSVPNAKVKPHVLTWDDFLREFRMKYVPPAYCDAKRKEFLNLRQRGMSIAEYQQKFLRLSRYAGGIIKEEKDKCRKFEDGFNDSIRKNVAILQHENFCKGPSKRGRFDNSKASSDNRPSQQKQSRLDFSTASTPNYGQGKPRVPTCPQCGKNHHGTCRRASGAFFNCGSFDHKVKDCPNPNNAPSLRTEGSVHMPSINPPQTNRGGRPKNTQVAGTSGANQASGQRATARAYATRQRDDQDGQDVVVVCNRIYRDCPFMIQSLVFSADVIEMPFKDFDVIIGMDWPHKYHPVVDCRSKHVTFKNLTFSHIIVQGERSLTASIISVTLAKKLMRQGCGAYLAHIVDTRLESPCIKDIHVVCDFLEVFLENLPGLPPEREVEFPIDLIPGSTPISITPYRMDPAKLRELKAQLQELLEKGFIRPSVSPWGAPVLFVKKKDGHVISAEGVKVDPSKIQAVIEWRPPKSPTEEVKFVWDDKCQESFETLKSLLTQVPILTLPIEGKEYVVYNDASHNGLGCVLMQEGKVISYASRILKSHELNYPIHYLELAGVVFALKIWWHYLYGEKCHIFTDHKSLKYLGKANVVANALSRKSFASISLSRLPLLLELRAMNVCFTPDSNGSVITNLQVKPILHEQVKEAQKIDETLVKLTREVQNREKLDFTLIENGVLFYQNKLCIPNDDNLRKKILDEAHTSPYAMHPGGTKMYLTIKEHYWWNGMKRDIVEFISKCLVCQQVKVEHQVPVGLLQPLSMPEWK
ncbi:uncharacterized protein LOC125867445 [Solanum stenotomum]|uniref:uncharacterized protein LOC125867445 n=1 Tax=Solanum stenotomum TaxID=172797 RepID=UPI0020D191F4|nr:uncharacterized protein LOC125867445 [Solanum stenotomum]